MSLNFDNIYRYHAPTSSEQVTMYQDIREKARELAELLRSSCPASRELDLAYVNVEQAVMWANASIARGGEK